MGKVDCLAVPGCECWFYSKDHPPEHFHCASPGEWELKVFFLRCPVEYEIRYEVRRVPRRMLRSILSLAEANREDLFTEWSRKVTP